MVQVHTPHPHIKEKKKKKDKILAYQSIPYTMKKIEAQACYNCIEEKFLACVQVNCSMLWWKCFFIHLWNVECYGESVFFFFPFVKCGMDMQENKKKINKDVCDCQLPDSYLNPDKKTMKAS